MKKKTVNVNGINIAYLEDGSPHSPCVLLLHGWPETSLTWKDIIPSVVESGFRAIAPDLPGFGQSEPFAEELTLGQYVDFITSFIQQLNVINVHLFLHDWGGIIGLKWAAENPSRVLSLFFGDTLYTHYAKWHWLGKIIRTPLIGERVIARLANRTRWNKTMKKEIPKVTDEVLEDFQHIFTTKKGQQISLQIYRNVNFNELKSEAGRLSQIKKPVTIVWGENDQYTPKDLAFIIKEKELRQAAVHIVPGAGHFIHSECPGAIQRLVKLHFYDIKQGKPLV